MLRQNPASGASRAEGNAVPGGVKQLLARSPVTRGDLVPIQDGAWGSIKGAARRVSAGRRTGRL